LKYWKIDEFRVAETIYSPVPQLQNHMTFVVIKSDGWLGAAVTAISVHIILSTY
jgi:hypothetical protein